MAENLDKLINVDLLGKFKQNQDEYNKKTYAKKGETSGSGGSVIADTTMSDFSENPVQNKVIKKYIDEKLGKFIDSVKIHEGNLFITYTDGTMENVGKIIDDSQGSVKVNISQSTENGKITVNGVDIPVYDDTEVRELSYHENAELLNKLSVSITGELLYDDVKVGNYFHSSAIEKTVESANNELLYDIAEIIQENHFVISSEILLQNNGTEESSISIFDNNIEIMNITLVPQEVQRYNLGASGTLKILVTGNILSKLNINYCRRSVQ